MTVPKKKETTIKKAIIKMKNNKKDKKSYSKLLMYVRIYVCICIYIYTDTYIHTHAHICVYIKLGTSKRAAKVRHVKEQMHVKSHVIRIHIESNKMETKLYTKLVTSKKKVDTLGSRMIYSKWLCISNRKINRAAKNVSHEIRVVQQSKYKHDAS